MALAIHPAVREAAALVRAAQGNWLQVGLKPNPEIGYSGQEIGNEGTAGQQGGFVSQRFVTAGKLGLNRAVAMRELAVAEQRLQRARLQVITTSRQYYIELLAAERFVSLARQLSELAAQAVRVSEQRLKALDIPRVSLLQIQVESESTALLEEQANQRYDAAWRRLANATGLREAQSGVLEDVFQKPLPELTWQAERERILRDSPELAELRMEVERARWAVERAAAGRVPDLNVQAGTAFDYASNDTIASVQLSMPVPVFDRNQGALAQARGELAAAQAALQRLKLALEQRLAAALRDYQTARERVARYVEKVLPVARESLELTAAGYREGELDYISVLAAQQAYAEKNLGYLQDLETAWKKWAEIDSLLVGPLPDKVELTESAVPARIRSDSF
jgi:cobalt-zinc-cadmium efflux system outer membrane protein